MYTNKTKVWLVALAASFVGLSACNNEDLPEKSETTNSEYVIVEGTGERITLDLSGQADLDAFNAQDESARYAIATKGNDPRVKPVINLDAHVGEGKAKPLLLRLVDKNAPDKISEIIVPADKLLFEGKQGAYTFKLKVELKLQEGQSFESGEWYVSGVYGGTEAGDPSKFVHGANNARLYTSDDTKVELPGVSLVIPWTRIYTKASPHPTAKADVGRASMDKLPATLGRNFRLRLKPDGVLMRIRPVSNVIEDVLITGIRLRTQELVMGTHTYTKPTTVDVNDLTSGAYPQVSSVSEVAELDLERINAFQGRADANTGKILRKGDYGNIEMFAWGFPKPGVENDNSKRTGAWLISRGYNSARWNSLTQVVDNGTASGAIIDRDPKDVTFFEYNPEKPNPGIQSQFVSERWGARNLYQLVQKQKFERGKVYLMLPRLESDLQITERYSHVQDPNDAQRYSVIEIHNPTLRDIDLNDYGLARIAVTGFDDAVVPTLGLYDRGAALDTYNPAKYTNINNGEMYAFPEMSSMFNNEKTFYDDTKPFQNIENFSRALVLPMTSKYPSASIGMTIQGSKTMEYNPKISGAPEYQILGSTSKADYPAQYVDYTTKLGGSTAYDVTGATPNILAPGQTMIILSNGYLDSSKFTDVSSNKTADNIPTFFADIKKGIQTGFCKYVVAMNNAKDKNAAPMNADAGVMTMGGYDIPLLLKRRPTTAGSSGFYYQLIDGLWMNGSLAWYLGINQASPHDAKTQDALYYADQQAANRYYGIASQYIKANNRNRNNGEHAGLWEKRTPSDLFNKPIVTNWAVGRMTCAQDYAVGQADNFTNFGVRLFQDQTTPRNPANYVVKWSAKK